MKVLVAGTTGGIGGAVAQVLREAGHSVVAWDRAQIDAGEPIGEAGLRGIVFAIGACPVRPVALTMDELLDGTVHVNCTLFLRLMREVVSRRLYAPEGLKAVAVSSVSATEGWPGGAAYCASKGALSAMCRAMDAELRGRRLSVVALEPRWIRTRMFDSTAGRMGVPAASAQDPRAFAREVLEILEKES